MFLLSVRVDSHTFDNLMDRTVVVRTKHADCAGTQIRPFKSEQAIIITYFMCVFSVGVVKARWPNG